jgi:hypothetical protein
MSYKKISAAIPVIESPLVQSPGLATEAENPSGLVSAIHADILSCEGRFNPRSPFPLDLSTVYLFQRPFESDLRCARYVVHEGRSPLKGVCVNLLTKVQRPRRPRAMRWDREE